MGPGCKRSRQRLPVLLKARARPSLDSPCQAQAGQSHGERSGEDQQPHLSLGSLSKNLPPPQFCHIQLCYLCVCLYIRSIFSKYLRAAHVILPTRLWFKYIREYLPLLQTKNEVILSLDFKSAALSTSGTHVNLSQVRPYSVL